MLFQSMSSINTIKPVNIYEFFSSNNKAKHSIKTMLGIKSGDFFLLFNVGKQFFKFVLKFNFYCDSVILVDIDCVNQFNKNPSGETVDVLVLFELLNE